MRRDDWLLAQLPVGMVEDDFFVRFVSIFQEVATSLMHGVDNLENVLDLTVAPEPMVRWLASWIGVESVDASLPHTLQRKIVQTSTRMLAWRGTRHGLRQFLELVSGAPVEIEDSGGVFAEGGAADGPPWVRMHVGSTGWLPEADFITLVRDEVPANVTIELWAGNRLLLPAESPDAIESAVPEQRSSSDIAAVIRTDGEERRVFGPPDIPEARESTDNATAIPDIPDARQPDREGHTKAQGEADNPGEVEQ